jgi:hypothetical protein
MAGGNTVSAPYTHIQPTAAAAAVAAVAAVVGNVTTILGNQWVDPHFHPSPHDGTGAAAVLSSGAWAIQCLPDGSAVLIDRQLGAIQHICPPGVSAHAGRGGGHELVTPSVR